MQQMDLKGQYALITGASKGIGAACALALSRAGAQVGINFRNDIDEAAEIKRLCEQEGALVELFQADVSDPVQVKGMFGRIKEKFGRLDILIANAGIQIDKAFIDLTPEDWNKVMSVNLSGQFYCAQQAAKMFIEQGVNSDISQAAGKIIHMSSVHDRIPWPGHCNYAASKGGVKMLMESMALELAENKIRVNAVSPGAIKTSINTQVWQNQEARQKLLKIIPYQRIGQAEEVGNAVCWLCSDQADYITGTTIYIDGGMTLYPSFLNNG